MNEPSIAGWANGTGGLVTWLRAVGAAVVTLVACVTAWVLLTARVEAAEHRIDQHGAELQRHTEAIRVLEDGRIRDGWHLYVLCKANVKAGLADQSDCVKPPERP